MSIERLLGMGPVAPPPSVFFCSPSRLAFAAFERHGEEAALRRYATVELPADTFQHGLLGGPPREQRPFEERVAAFVGSLGVSVPQASLVVPDAWLRTAFAEVGELPRNGASRDEVLRWKLKRLVPFRVDELRVRAVEVEPLPDQQDPRRILLGFAIESLLAGIESAFRAAGVHLGGITNAGLAALGALRAPAVAGDGAITGVALVDSGGYTLAFARSTADGSEPVMHRFKAFSGPLPTAAQAASVRRDLRLTRSFLEEQYPTDSLASLVLASADEETATWAVWLEEAFNRVVEPAGVGERVPFAGTHLPEGEAPPWPDLLPLLGAACQEVAG